MRRMIRRLLTITADAPAHVMLDGAGLDDTEVLT
jgi:hypothetical protein